MIGSHRVAGWIRRSCCALLADLEIVESGSLDVLLYCGDELTAFDDAPSGAIDRVVDR